MAFTAPWKFSDYNWRYTITWRVFGIPIKTEGGDEAFGSMEELATDIVARVTRSKMRRIPRISFTYSLDMEKKEVL